MKTFITLASSLFLSACSVFGHQSVEIAPYDILRSDNAFEVRYYEQMMLVTTPMTTGDDTSSSFYKLFNYISGENGTAAEISMTAPVFMDKTGDADNEMSFVLPANFTFENAPVPNDPDVMLEEVKDYTVATIQFNGRLTQKAIKTNTDALKSWIIQNEYEITGAPKAAGYNAPFTLPMFRRNEILIPITYNE